MKIILQKILKILSRAVISKYKPVVIGITGSAGKTSTKEAVFAVLSKKFAVAKNEANFNNDIGVPMAILRLKKPGKFIWILNIFKALRILISKDKNYPRFLVLEMAADRPGDIGYLASIARPFIGVVTTIGETPVHVEYYAGPQEVAKEKAKLIKALPAQGLAVLNYDDDTVLSMKDHAKATSITFGFASQANIRATDVNFSFADGKIGISFKLNYGISFVPVKLPGVLAKHLIYGALAATAIGLNYGMNLVEISQALREIDFPKGRMNLIKGVKNTWIIDDTYNASPIAMRAALESLDELYEFMRKEEVIPLSSRKIGILGDMAELGQYTIQAHESIGNLAAEKCDALFAVGPRAKFIAEAAMNQLGKDKIFTFPTPDEAKLKIQEFIKQGDIILVKGSQSMRLEKIVKEIMAEPDKAGELLVRQSEHWLKKR